MFEGNEENASGPGTVVGANVKLTGTISDVNDIVIHGTVEGEIISDKTVTITETASVKGPITAQMVSVSGKVNGAVTSHDKLELLPTANVSGSISAADLIIKSGALFNGKSSMSRDDDKATPAKSDDKADNTKDKSTAAKSEKKDDKDKEAKDEKKEPLPAANVIAAPPAVELEE